MYMTLINKLPLSRRAKILVLILVPAVLVGGLHYHEHRTAIATAQAVHQGDPVTADAIRRARESYDTFFERSLSPEKGDRFAVLIGREDENGKMHKIFVAGINRKKRYAVFIPIGESNDATVLGPMGDMPANLKAGSTVSFSLGQVIDWVHVQPSGKIAGGFMMCAEALRRVGRMDLANHARKEGLDCNWVPPLKTAGL